jgi:hypothetical protein
MSFHSFENILKCRARLALDINFLQVAYTTRMRLASRIMIASDL